MDSYGMTNVVDRLGEWLILCLERVSCYVPTYTRPLSFRRNLDHRI